MSPLDIETKAAEAESSNYHLQNDSSSPTAQRHKDTVSSSWEMQDGDGHMLKQTGASGMEGEPRKIKSQQVK